MDSFDFYCITQSALTELASQHNVDNLEKYYSLTDFLAFPQLNSLSEVGQAFMQIAFHGQNATIISNIVSFERNYASIKSILCNFSPLDFSKKYSSPFREENISDLLTAFRNGGIFWNSGKSQKRPSAIMTRYASLLLDAAEYLKHFETKQAIIDDLSKHYTDGNIKELVTYFRSKVKAGFSIALTCDFLKEFSTDFCDLPKPDIHIMDTLCVLKGYAKDYYNTEARIYTCIRDMQQITAEINYKLKEHGEKTITVYQLDRMIWLLCSNKFFLDDKDSKNWYLSKLKQ